MLLTITVLSGCATAVRDESLRVNLYNYSAAVRWNEIAQAADFVDPLIKAEKPFTDADRARWAQVQVTRYYEGLKSTDPNGDYRQTVQVEIVDRATQSVRTITDRQVWRYDEAAKTWWLTTGLPDLDAVQ
jgi:hypothetical protein